MQDSKNIKENIIYVYIEIYTDHATSYTPIGPIAYKPMPMPNKPKLTIEMHKPNPEPADSR